MEPAPSTNVNIPLDRNRDHYISSLIEGSAASSVEAVANMTATAISLPTTNNQLVLYTERPQFSSTTSVGSATSQPSHSASTSSTSSASSAPIEKLSRPMAFDKMEALVKEMQDPESGVPVRSQKIFLTSIPSAFMGYDLIEWLMEQLNVEESEALNMGNQLCQHGYFFPVNDSKTLIVKDDSSLYRFQSPYYWPWRQPQKAPDQIEYAIYLAKRSLRNKQRHGLEDYENEALASLNKNLKGKWDFIMMQAEEQIKLSKDRKKGDKIVSDSQERAYWRVHRPPPGQFTPLEPCPVPSRDRQGKPRKRTEEDWKREVKITRSSLGRNRMKMSAACESLVSYYETFAEYDPLMQPALPSNPWVSEDITFWQLNSSLVDVPTEKRVKRWSISIEELIMDPTGLIEFTTYLRKEYSHENIRFWLAVIDLRRSAHSQIARKAKEIYSEFLEPGAPCEINIDGKTMEKVQQGLKAPSRFTFDVAADHVYLLLLKKDCYPRFIRSEHYKNLLANAIQPSQKKRFFGFGGPTRKKPSATASTAQGQGLMTQMPGPSNNSSLPRRRGSDRSLSGSAHELAVCGINKDPTKVPHSHSQSNLSEIPYRTMIYRGDMDSQGVLLAEGIQEPTKQLETTLETCQVCPWDTIESDPTHLQPPPSPATTANTSKPKLTVDLPSIPFTSSSSDIINTDVSERMKRSCGIRQNTVDENFHSSKRLAPVVTEQRRASMTMAPRISDLHFNITPPPPPTTTPTTTTILIPVSENSNSNNIKVATNVSTSELSLVINKAESIEEDKEAEEIKTSSESLQQQKTTRQLPKKSDDVIEEVIRMPVVVCVEERKASIIDRQKSTSETQNMSIDIYLPTSISTQTLPTEEFPETSSANDQGVAAAVIDDGQEVIQMAMGIKKIKSRSIEDKEIKICGSGKTSMDEEDEELYHKSSKLMQQQQQSQEDDFEVSMVSGLLPGCVAPAPTPAPSIAPLAEVELDPTEEDTPSDTLETEQKPEVERKKKRREKKDREASTSQGEASAEPDKAKRNAVCPWEDEEMTTTVETPFVKTYATLGYL